MTDIKNKLIPYLKNQTTDGWDFDGENWTHGRFAISNDALNMESSAI